MVKILKLFKKLMLPKKAVIIGIIFSLGFTTFSILLFNASETHVSRGHDQANVVIFSKEDDTTLITALSLDTEAIDLDIITEDTIDEEFNEELIKNTDVIVVDRFLPKEVDQLTLLKCYVNGTNASCGLIFFGGLRNDDTAKNDFSSDQIDQIASLLPVKVTEDVETAPSDAAEEDHKIQVALKEELQEEKDKNPSKVNILVKHISWTSCPLIANLFLDIYEIFKIKRVIPLSSQNFFLFDFFSNNSELLFSFRFMPINESAFAL